MNANETARGGHAALELPPIATIGAPDARHRARRADRAVTEPVAAKKRRGKKKWSRSPESIAKQKATLAARKAANGKPEKTLVSQRAGKPPKNPVEIQVTGVQAWLRAELEALKPELRRLVREELRAMLGGS